MHARSALTKRTKRTIHTQEVLRILRNCSKHLPQSVANRHVEQYVNRMQFSGHNREFRAQIVESAIQAYTNMLERDAKGEQPLYRPKGWRKIERTETKRSKRNNWFRGNENTNETVIFIPATPGGDLRKRFTTAIAEAGAKISVAEIPGTSLKRRLQRSDPFREKKCGDSGCMVCEEGDGGRCRVNGITYEITCKVCKDTYIGETARNAYTRGNEHKASISATLHPDRPKPTLRHPADLKHAADANPPSFEMRVTGVFGGDALKRQISEAVMIRNSESQMNRQDEWRQINLPRLDLA